MTVRRGPHSGIPRPRRAAAWALAGVPYVTLAFALHGVTSSWPQALGNAGLLFGLMWAHATCYALWQPYAKGRILLNELLTRLWFALDAVLVAGWLDLDLRLVGTVGLVWAVASWGLHRRLVRTGYVVVDNVALLGLFLAGLAVVLDLA